MQTEIEHSSNNEKKSLKDIMANPVNEYAFWSKLHNKRYSLQEELQILARFEGLLLDPDAADFERLPTFIGGLYTFTSYDYKDIQTGLMYLGKATLLKDANTLYKLGDIYQNTPELDNHLVEAARFFRRSYALANDAARDKLLSIRDENPSNILIQYQCNMAIAMERIDYLFAEQVLHDQFTTDQGKYYFFTCYQSQLEGNTSSDVYAKIQDFMKENEKKFGAKIQDLKHTKQVLSNIQLTSYETEAKDLLNKNSHRILNSEFEENSIDAKELYQIGILLLSENHPAKAAFFFRKAYVLSNKDALSKLLSLRDDYPLDVTIQYHYTMATSPELINELFEDAPESIIECLIFDNLLVVLQIG